MLTYAAPVAKNAGVSIEETAAMVGALHDEKSQRLNGGDGKPCRVKPPAGTDGKSMGCTQRACVKTSDSKETPDQYLPF